MALFSQSSANSGWLRPLAVLTTVAVLAAQSGCMHRRLTIRSNPPGAVVYVDDYEIGTTPVSHDFTYYGTRKIRLVKDGYETLTVLQPISMPWYEIPPLDLVSENFVPGEIRDHRTFTYTLTPQLMVPPDQLRQRAEQLRQQTQAQAAVPVGPRPGGLAPPAATYVPPGGSASAPSGPLPPAVPSPSADGWQPAVGP